MYFTLHRKSPLKEDNPSTEDKTAGPEGERFHCIINMKLARGGDVVIQIAGHKIK